MAAEVVRRLDIRLLGPLEVRRAGREVPIGGTQARVVLARLLVDRRRVVGTDRLEEALWPDEPPDAASVTLRAYVSRLRRVLGSAAQEALSEAPDDPRIRPAGPGYVLEVRSEAVDADRFERAAAEGREALTGGRPDVAAERLQAGLAEWRGPVLGDLPELPFVVGAAARLDAIRLTATEDRFEADLALGRSAEIVPALEELARSGGVRERAWELLMLALYRSGRQADALAAFREVRRRLVDELGIEPGPGLQQLQGAILRHDVPAAPGRPRQGAARRPAIPRPVTSFIGRGAELAAIETALAASRVVTLTGAGGTGKTRLALEHAARATAGRDSVDVVLAELAALPPGASEADVAGVVAAAAGIELRPPHAAEATVADELGSAATLVILDTCEHLADAAAALAARIVAPGDRVRVLATSREPLAIAGEAVVAVGPLPVPSGVAVGADSASSPDDAVRLFLDRARVVRPHPEPGPIDVVAEICRRLDGLPLAIELAAARTATLTPTQIAERLDERLRFLRAWSRHVPVRQRTLEATIDWSYRLLNDDTRHLLAQLGIFAGPFALEDAAAVVGLPAGVVDERLGSLVRASLVTAEVERDAVRHRLLETVRAFARERLAEGPDEPAARRAHAERMLVVADRLRAARWTPAESAAFDRLEALREDLRMALEHGLELEPGVGGVRLAVALGPFWRIRGHLDEGIRWHRRALQVVDATVAPDRLSPSRLRAAALGQLGGLLGRGAGIAEAEECLDAAVAEAAAAGDRPGQAEWLHMRAFVRRRRGDLDAAASDASAAVAIQREIGEIGGLAWSLGSLADIATLRGDLEAADVAYREGAVVVAAAGDPPALVTAYLESRARLAVLLGEPARAIALAGRALELAEALGDRWHVGLAATILARQRVAAGDPAAALALARRALEVLATLGDETALAEAAEVAACAFAADGRDEPAARLLGAADAARERIRAAPAAPSAAPLGNPCPAVTRRLRSAYAAALETGRSLGIAAVDRTLD